MGGSISVHSRNVRPLVPFALAGIKLTSLDNAKDQVSIGWLALPAQGSKDLRKQCFRLTRDLYCLPEQRVSPFSTPGTESYVDKYSWNQ